MNTKIFILFVGMCLVMSYGCSQPESPESCAKTAGSAGSHNGEFDGLPVHHETQTETLARILAGSEAPKSKVDGAARKEWYGSTLLGLGRLRRIAIPHVAAGSDSESREVTTLQIQKALTEYVLTDYEDYHLSTHIPMGTRVAIEYENGVIGWVNMYAGIPYDVNLQKDGTVGQYGLEKTSEQRAPRKAASPPQ